MVDKLHFNLVSPERQLVSEDVDQVDVPGSEGIFGVLAKHASVMANLAPGVIRIKNDGAERRIFVRGGFAEVTPAGLTILAEEAIPVRELDAAAIAQRIRDCEQDIADADSTEATRQRARDELVQLKELQAAL